MKRFFLALLCATVAIGLTAKDKPPTTYTIPLPPKPNFAPLEWLVGNWVGKTNSRGPQGEIHLSVAYALDKRFMIFQEDLTLAAGHGTPAARESWMGVLSGGPDGGLLLETYSSTGFVMRYRVIADGTEIRLNPEGGPLPPPGWLFRRVIRQVGDAEFTETVEAAPPNKAFFDYYSARFTRNVAGEKPAAPAPSPAKK